EDLTGRRGVGRQSFGRALTARRGARRIRVPYNGATVSTPPPRHHRPLFVAAVALLALTATPVPAQAQAKFKVTYQVERTDSNRVYLAGRVYNDASVDAVDVYVTAEALDASGKELARGVAFVARSIPARSDADFSARVPTSPGRRASGSASRTSASGSGAASRLEAGRQRARRLEKAAVGALVGRLEPERNELTI